MTDLMTSRLLLHPIDITEAERIVTRTPGPEDAWAEDYPFDGDLRAVGGFLRASTERGEQRPFGYYRVTRSSDGLAVGGIGFKGGPDDGCVEIGYGLAPSARGHGYAAEAVVALLGIAATYGVVKVIADTTLDNVASQRTLVRAGFHLVATDEELHHFEFLLGDLPVHTSYTQTHEDGDLAS
jgi:RimJ/RimL family protein N-acetyltransferase